MPRKLIIISTLLLVALLAVACGADAATRTPTTTAIPTSETPSPGGTAGDGDAMMGGAWELTIVNFSHEDATVTVGTTVNWTNTGSAQHTTISGAPEAPTGLWDSGNLSTDDTHSYTFNNTGTFAYYCQVHPTMMATITVMAEGEDTTDGEEDTTEESETDPLYD